MKQWVTKACHADLHKIAERYQVSEVFAEILVKRGLYCWQDMDGYLFDDMGQEREADTMWGLKDAVSLLSDKIQQKRRIRIIGDYDVDGVMSTFILYHGLKLLGGELSYQIPHREKDGYGIRSYMAEQAAADGVDTIVTCDNGISAMEAVSRAKELGMTVIITDHHEVPVIDGAEQIPPADVVIDPKQGRCGYGYRDLCGAGIAYKLIRSMLCSRGMDQKADELLPFAAIATVCDVVPLQGENRLLVKQGLRQIQTVPNPGLQALIRKMEFSREIRAMDFGFRLGPCINAAGRLEDAAKGLELFLESDPGAAFEKAEYLYHLNESRKDMTFRETAAAVRQIEAAELPQVLVVYLPECHESVAGIVAGRLREKYYRPVYMITDSGDHLKGSGRSIPGYHMQQALLACREHLMEFGGHAMAAGFSLKKTELAALRQALLYQCTLTEADMVEKVYFDKEVNLSEIDQSLVTQLAWLEPLGEGNPGAVFAKRDAVVHSVRMCGKENQVAQIQIVEDGNTYRAVDFHAEDCLGAAVCARYGTEEWERMKTGAEGDWKLNILFTAELDRQYGSLQLQLSDCQ